VRIAVAHALARLVCLDDVSTVVPREARYIMHLSKPLDPRRLAAAVSRLAGHA